MDTELVEKLLQNLLDQIDELYEVKDKQDDEIKKLNNTIDDLKNENKEIKKQVPKVVKEKQLSMKIDDAI